MNRAPVITIDGPSGSGKGTIGELLAQRLGWHYLDSGALYRIVGMIAEKEGISADRADKLEQLARNMDVTFEQGKILLDGEDVGRELRTERIGNAASRVAAVPEVRRALLAWQRGYAKEPGLVTDGRDMGTVVFPDAEVKIFLNATPEERARRRYNQLKQKGISVSLATLTGEIRERDERDRNRSVAPLKVPAAALEVESTGLSIEEVLRLVLEKVRSTFPALRI